MEKGVRKQGPQAASVLDAIDREIGFYRHRSGQVYFFALLVEVLILAGKHEITLPKGWPWLPAAVASILFIAVALTGTVLGSEYRRRIRRLKLKRDQIVIAAGFSGVFPSLDGEVVSEIQVLYFILAFTSSEGILISWINVYPTWPLLILLVATGALGIVGAAIWAVWRIYSKHEGD